MNQGMQGMQNVFSGINRQIQDYNELPTPTAVPGNTWGMSAQAFNNTANIIQKDNQMSATAKMQQRVQMEQQMEQEKERSQQLKVQEMQFKNQQKMEKFRLDQEEARLKRKATIGDITTGPDGTQVYRGIGADGTPYAKAVPITGYTAKPDVMPQQYVETVDANGNPIKRLATMDELKTGVPLYVAPNNGSQPRYQMIETVDENGRVVQKAVPVQEGTSYPVPPSAASGGVGLKDWAAMQQRFYQQNISAKAASSMEFDPTAEMEAARLQTEQILGPKPMPGQGAPAQPSAPLAQGGGQAAPAQNVNPGDTFTGTDGNSYKYLGGNNYEPVGQAPLASTPAQPSSAPSNAPLAGTTPPQVNTGYDLMNPVFSAQNGNPYQGPVAYPAPSAIPGALSRSNYIPPPPAPPRSLEQVIADAQALKAQQFEERNASLLPVNSGQSMADLARGSGYVAPPEAPPRELSAADKWLLATGETITREADAAMRSALTFLANVPPRAGKNNSVFDNVAKGLLDNKVPIPVIRERFKQYPGVMSAVANEYYTRTGTQL
jgi:hypothetical protein